MLLKNDILCSDTKERDPQYFVVMLKRIFSILCSEIEEGYSHYFVVILKKDTLTTL